MSRCSPSRASAVRIAAATAVLLAAALAGPARAEGTAPVSSTAPVLSNAIAREKGLPFGPGESLKFSIEYGLIKAGTAWLEVAPMQVYKGRPCYHLVSRAESNDVMSKLYKVRDRIDSLVDAEGLYSWRYKKRMREGSFERDYDILYDPPSGKATYSDGRKFDAEPWSKDALAAFYYVRHMPLEVGKDIAITHHSDKRSNGIQVQVHKRETVKVPAGTFDCFVIEPIMSEGGLFKSSGRMQIWVTADERRIPVLMKSKIPVGSIDAVLTEYKTGGPASVAIARP